MPYPSKWAGLNQGLLGGFNTAMEYGRLQAEQKRSEQVAKQAEAEQAIKMMREASADLSKKGLSPSVKKMHAETYNQAATKLNAIGGYNFKMQTGDVTPEDSDAFKTISNTLDHLTELAANGRISEINPALKALSNDIGNQEPDIKKENQGILASVIASKYGEPTATVPSTPSPIGPTPQGPPQGSMGEPVTATTPDIQKIIDSAKTMLAGNPEALKQLDALQASKQSRTANAFANDFISQPEGSWQQGAIQGEATTSQYSNPDTFRKAIEGAQKMRIQEQRAEWKPPQPWGMTSDKEGNQVAVGFDPNLKKIVTYSVPFTGQVDPITKGRTPASELGKTVMLDTISGNLERIKKEYKPDYVGFVTGRAKQLQATTVGGLPEVQSSFYADVNDIADMLLRARSGAQINEQEYQRLSKLVPTPNLPPSTFKARLDRFETQLNQIKESQKTRLKEGGYLSPKSFSNSAKPKTWEELKKAKGY